MSFEMASRFLTEAAVHNEYDALKTASAQIVLGRVIRFLIFLILLGSIPGNRHVRCSA